MQKHVINAETELALQQTGGPLEIQGQHGKYVVMRTDVYDAMLGIDGDDPAETIASIERGLTDVDAGRTRLADEVFQELRSRYAT